MGSKLTSLVNYVQLTDFSKKWSKWTDVNVRMWKGALTEVANLSGLEHSRSRSESKFITEVVETITHKLDLKQLSTPAHLIGMEARVEFITSWLKNEQSNVIAICGMGGGGKTTIAHHIYNLNKQHFQSSSFIEVSGKQPDGLLGLQKQLLKDVFGGKKIRISSVFEGTQKIEEVLRLKRMLIVLDDIDQQEQLSALLGTKTFPTQSKIIITTRVLDISSWLDTTSWRWSVQEIKLLNHIESIELLSSHAFRSKTPLKDFNELAEQLAQYCAGNPLALKVLGSSLFVSDEDPMTIRNMIEIWRSRINSLNSLKGNIHHKIEGVLRKSFDTLTQRSERELFLHIACFFVGESRHIVEMILEEELYAKSGISSLINRCLITISPDNRVMMHQLLQEMGRNVVCEKFKDPVKRSRVWNDGESYGLLRKGNGSDTLEGLSLDIRNVDQEMGSEELALETTSFANMEKLKLLQLKYVKLTGSFDNFPKLIWLCWHGCPLKTMPSGLLMSSLVFIDMSHGHMETFEVPTILNSVKRLKLIGCEKLVSIRNICRLPKLEDLILENCSSLAHLCKSIGDHENLENLELRGCTKLLNCVTQQDPMMLPWSLGMLDLSDCGLDSNNDLCVVFHAQANNIILVLAENPFEYLPNNIDLRKLRMLNLYSCPNLRSVTCIPSTLEDLQTDWCTSLERVTFQSERFSLCGFTYECCFKLFDVQGLFKLVPIAKIDERDLGHLEWIKKYANQKVDLVGDDITKGRIWNTQMLYEFGIMSTYLQGIKDQSLPTYEFTSSTGFLSFHVPLHHEKTRIQVISLSFIYRSSGSKDKGDWNLRAKISNITKGLTWVYSPMLYCKPIVDEDVAWLTYWPIGDTLDVSDKVHVTIFWEKGRVIVGGCGASIVYMDNGMCENNTMKEEEVIGGDLSEFEVAPGSYYLCRRDLFGLDTSYWLKFMFGDHVHYTDSQGWRKTRQSSFTPIMRNLASTLTKIIELKVCFDSESEIDKIEKAVSSIVGVKSVSAQKEIGKLTVTGCVDVAELTTCVGEFDSMVELLSVKLIYD